MRHCRRKLRLNRMILAHAAEEESRTKDFENPQDDWRKTPAEVDAYSGADIPIERRHNGRSDPTIRPVFKCLFFADKITSGTARRVDLISVTERSFSELLELVRPSAFLTAQALTFAILKIDHCAAPSARGQLAGRCKWFPSRMAFR
jgi:hypothetical protein